MKLGIFNRHKVTTVEHLIKNDDCKQLLEQILKEDLPCMTALIIAFEDNKQQTYFKSSGMEPAQAILTLDQLHHRIQHEGLPGYD